MWVRTRFDGALLGYSSSSGVGLPSIDKRSLIWISSFSRKVWRQLLEWRYGRKADSFGHFEAAGPSFWASSVVSFELASSAPRIALWLATRDLYLSPSIKPRIKGPATGTEQRESHDQCS
jgi:hypothetical protein